MGESSPVMSGGIHQTGTLHGKSRSSRGDVADEKLEDWSGSPIGGVKRLDRFFIFLEEGWFVVRVIPGTGNIASIAPPEPMKGAGSLTRGSGWPGGFRGVHPGPRTRSSVPPVGMTKHDKPPAETCRTSRNGESFSLQKPAIYGTFRLVTA